MKKQFFMSSLMLVLVLLSQCLYASIDDCSVLTDDDVVMNGNTIVEYKAKGVKTQIIIPDTLHGMAVEVIGAALFFDCNLTEVYLPQTLKMIESSAFYYNKLRSITIPSGVITIGTGAFKINGLNTLVFSENSKLQTLKSSAFSMNDISSIVLPESLVYLEANVFRDNPYEAVSFPRSGQEWVDIAGNSFTGGENIPDLEKTYIIKNYHTITDNDVVVEGGIITQCSYDFSATCITIPNVLDGQTIKGIGSHVFDRKNVLNVVLPDSIELIDSMAFELCMIQELMLPKGLRHVGLEAFAACDIKELSIPEGSKIEYIGAYAFAGNSIGSINMPQGIRYIGKEAFSGNLLTSINLPSSLRYIGAAAFNKNRISTLNGEDFNGIFYGLNSNGEKDITKIISYGGSDLTSLDIPEGVVTIGEQAFEQCTSLENITFPSSLKRIESRAFMGTGITTLDFSPTQLIYLGDRAFFSASSLSTINFEGCELLDSILYGCFNNARLVTNLNLNACTGLKYIGERAFSMLSRLESFEIDSCKALRCIEKDALKSARRLSGFKLPVLDSLVWNSGDVYFSEGSVVSDYSRRYTVKKICKHTVNFIDWDGALIITDTIMTGQTTTGPVELSREGYTFVGWGNANLVITKDTTFTAQYQINSFAVKFLDWNKDVLHTDTVSYRSAAKAPESPSRDNYNFMGWDKDFTTVESDLEVNALYQIMSYKVTFMDWDNQILAIDSVPYGSAATEPNAPSREGYTFIGWNTALDNITSDLIVLAQYSQTASLEESYAKSLKVYPNPARTSVVVESTQGEMVSLYSICGELIISVMAQNDKTIIDVSQLNTGVYIVQKDGLKQKLLVE